MRIGIGFDVHRFAAGRTLVLGGVEIPFGLGLAGHSDADVVCHAVIDAIFGAVAAGDIGSHFPDTDPQYKGISSLALLGEAMLVLAAANYAIGNIDIVILAEEPKLTGWREAMRGKLAETLGISVDRVSVKATTTEGLGFTGRGEGIAAQAVVLVEKQKTENREAENRK
ncbi:MAG: 2-C-methyl-D-erythritol 2,4-cyclodiphosphate synthase [Actinomycetota bacterium]|nr:2-C-methyl-D-erythritol 2,4-cyclodiphosphate synthase [Actinomycetota bacterium]